MARQSRDRLLLVMLVLAAVVGITVSYGISREDNWRRYEEAFEARSAELAESLSEKLDSINVAIYSVRSFIEGSEKVTDEEFAIFAEALLRNRPEIHSIHYILEISDAQRPIWELANGVSVSDLDESGSLGRAASRPSYMVLDLGYPEDVGTTFKGLDLSAFPKTRQALERTSASGSEFAICDVAVGSAGDGDRRGCVITLPVQHIVDRIRSGDDAPPTGYVMAVLDSDIMLAKLITGAENAGMLVRVKNSEEPEDCLIKDFAEEPLRRSCLALPDFPRSELSVEKVGLSLKLSFAATPKFQSENLRYIYLATIPAGLLMAAIAVMALLLVRKDKLKLQAMVEARVEELRSSEARYKEMFVSSYDPIFLINEHGAIEMANPAAAALTGRSSKELEGMRLEDLLSADAMLLGSGLVQRMREGTALRYEHRVMNASGGLTEVDGTYSSLPDGKIQAIWRDITDYRKR